MRKLLLVLLICPAIFISNHSSAQGYVPFPENEATWTVAFDNMDDFNPEPDKFYRYRVIGDTIINSLSYNKVYKETSVVTAFWDSMTLVYTSGTILQEDIYAFSYRNDSLNKKVYKVIPDSVNENLWYDFDLHVGDTIPYCMMQNGHINDTLTIAYIDSMYYCGTYRKTFFTNQTPCYWPETSSTVFYFIEGIGNTHDFTVPDCGRGEFWKYFFICFVDNDRCAPIHEESVCNYRLSDEIYTSTQLKVFPNPTMEKIYLPESMDEIYITDAMGRMILKTINTSIVDVSEFRNGIYFISASLKGKKHHSSFIKQ